MKKYFALFFMLIAIITFSANAQETSLINYIPSDGEMQYYMNYYERLKAIEKGTMDYKQLGDMYSAFENKNGRYYLTYQRLLFESYLLEAKNKDVRKYISDYLADNSISDRFSIALSRIYNSIEEKYEMDSKEYSRFNFQNVLFDENINLFNMNETTALDDQIGLMMFNNDWLTIAYSDKANPDVKFASYIYGGGTNSINIMVKEYRNIAFQDFKQIAIEGDFYRKKFSDYKISEVKKEGILARAGADRIYMGIGKGKDSAFDDIDNFSAILFMYSEERKSGYQIDYFMNISTKNINYDIRDLLYNHMLFQCMLSYIN